MAAWTTSLLLKQIDHAVLAILMVGGLLVVYHESGADFYFYIWLRKLLAALVALMNFFSSNNVRHRN